VLYMTVLVMINTQLLVVGFNPETVHGAVGHVVARPLSLIMMYMVSGASDIYIYFIFCGVTVIPYVFVCVCILYRT